MSSGQKKQAQHFSIIFMQQQCAQFARVRLSIPAYKKVKHIYQFLERENSNPFRSFFLTNKLKERAQFTEDREIKEIKDELRKDRHGNYVILCYQDKTKTDPDAKRKDENKEDLRATKDAKDPKEDEKNKEGTCSVM